MGSFLGSQFMTDIFEGINTGAIYALVALSLVIIWQSTHILNFAQGSMAMFATYVGLTLTDRNLPYFVCVLIAVACGFLLGGVTERVLVRPLYGKPEINPIVVMVGFLGLLEFVITAIWSNTARTVTAPFSEQYFIVNGNLVLLSPWILFRLGLALVIMLGMAALFRFTNLGLQLRAAAAAPEVSRLLGVRVSRLLTFGWMISCAVGAVAAVVYTTGGTGMVPTAMEAVFVSGFIAAAIGGLESPVGAVVGALILGISTQLVSDYWSSNAGQAVPLVLLVVVLAIRPQGLFTKHVARRV
jgi:branched-chain amino acid transport system permease protein